jgi:hypothetical protein
MNGDFQKQLGAVLPGLLIWKVCDAVALNPCTTSLHSTHHVLLQGEQTHSAQTFKPVQGLSSQKLRIPANRLAGPVISIPMSHVQEVTLQEHELYMHFDYGLLYVVNVISIFLNT